MSTSAKYHASRVIGITSAVIAAYCVAQLVAPGLSGDTHTVRVWFAVALFAILIGIPCIIASYYYRSALKNPTNIPVASVRYDIPDLPSEPKHTIEK